MKEMCVTITFVNTLTYFLVRLHEDRRSHTDGSSHVCARTRVCMCKVYTLKRLRLI